MSALPSGILVTLALCLALVLGLFLGLVLGRRHARQLAQADALLAQERLAFATRDRDAALQQLEVLHGDARDLHELVRRARDAELRATTQLDAERAAGEEKLALLETARDTLSAQFRTLANEILEERGRRLSEQSRSELDLILKPLGEKIAAFEKKVDETYVAEAKERHSLADEVRRLHQANQRIGEEALNLTRALKGDAKSRGNWGEVILERVLERSGLVRGREFEVQVSVGDGPNRVQPDVVVHLPEQRHLVIDAKVSLVAYDRYYSSETEAARAEALRELLTGMRAHVRELSAKNYSGRIGPESPDFVAMFVPIEPAFNLAAAADESLYLDAFERRVVIVTPGTLLAMLSMVATLWRREKQGRNAVEIATRAGQLYDKFTDFVVVLQEIGQRLDAAQKAYDTAHNRLVGGRGNLVRRVEELRALGANADKELPASLLDAAQDDDTVTPLPLPKSQAS